MSQDEVQESEGISFDGGNALVGIYHNNSHPVLGFDTARTDFGFNTHGELYSVTCKIKDKVPYINFHFDDKIKDEYSFDYDQLKDALTKKYGAPAAEQYRGEWKDKHLQLWPWWLWSEEASGRDLIYDLPVTDLFDDVIVIDVLYLTTWETDRSEITLAMAGAVDFGMGVETYIVYKSLVVDGPPEPEAEKPSVPQKDEKDFYRYEIVDKRLDKVSLEGKYFRDTGSPWNSYGWDEEYYFEIFDDHIIVSNSLVQHDGVVEIAQHEGLTWVCFTDAMVDDWYRGPLNLYLYKPGVLIMESFLSDIFNEHSNASYLTYKREDLIYEEQHEKEAQEREKALLDFDPDTFYLDKTYGEVKKLFPDLHCEWYESGSFVYYTKRGDKYFRIGAGIEDLDNPPDEAEIYGFGAKAKTIFYNMGAWIFKEEVRRIADTYWEGYDTLTFTYQGYVFTVYYEESYDITPNALVMVNELYYGDA